MATRDPYQALTLADLFAARDAYQVHLTRLPNVVGTALGLYLEREEEAAENLAPAARRARPATGREPRTLANSSVRPGSWPCVLVFVKAWLSAAEIRSAPDAMVPRELFLPDGRRVPTCVVFTPPVEGPDDRVPTLSLPSALIGGGYACEAVVQGQPRAGTIACLVTDGDIVSALTNRHVAGDPGRELFTEVRGSAVRIGISAGRSVGRVPLATAYPGLPGARVELQVDAALVQLDDVESATAQVYGLGTLGDVVDVGGANSLSLDLVGQRVRAFGGASGAMQGQVLALSYRYKSLAGTDYVADVLIGPRNGAVLPTRHGDSGTLWVADGAPLHASDDQRPQPIALQWGGHRFGTGAKRESPYVLATFLSTALAQLDVDLVTDFHADLPDYWGPVGHYTIGALACDHVGPASWKAYMVANRSNIAFETDDLVSGAFDAKQRLYVPLADAPDRLYKKVLVPALAKTVPKRGRERPNHFADIDQPRPGTERPETLLSWYLADPVSLAPDRWLAFYDDLSPSPGALDRGMVPFRVAQIYREAVEALEQGDVLHGVCALGVMAHYVGDACQPLHGSQFSNGRPEDHHKDVHGAYEDDMVDRHAEDLRDGLTAGLQDAALPTLISGHQAAARATMDLMARTAERLPPLAICDAWQAPGATPETLWLAFGDATVACLRDGVLTLAMLWTSAFAESGAEAPAPAALDRVAITDLITEPSFATSMTLELYASSGLW